MDIEKENAKQIKTLAYESHMSATSLKSIARSLDTIVTIMQKMQRDIIKEEDTDVQATNGPAGEHRQDNSGDRAVP